MKDFRGLNVIAKVTEYLRGIKSKWIEGPYQKGLYNVASFRLAQNSSIPARSVNNFLPTSQISRKNKSRCSKHRIKELVYKISFPALRFLFFHRISFHKWAIIENETVLRGGRERETQHKGAQNRLNV